MCASGKFSTSTTLDDALVSIFETGNCINFDQNGSSKKITPLRSIICHLEEYIIRDYITIVQFHILYYISDGSEIRF